MQRFSPGTRAIVFGASGGIGCALIAALDRAGVSVIGLGRRTEPFVDLEDEQSIARAAEKLGEAAPFHIIVDATGRLTEPGDRPEKRLADVDPAIMARSFAINAIGPALLFKHFAGLLPPQGRCVFATLSARVGSITDNRLGGWYSYRASKAALNQIVRCAAIEIARKRPDAVVLALHPNTVRTSLSTPFIGADKGIATDEAAAMLLSLLATAAESGAFLDYAGRSIPW